MQFGNIGNHLNVNWATDVVSDFGKVAKQIYFPEKYNEWDFKINRMSSRATVKRGRRVIKAAAARASRVASLAASKRAAYYSNKYKARAGGKRKATAYSRSNPKWVKKETSSGIINDNAGVYDMEVDEKKFIAPVGNSAATALRKKLIRALAQPDYYVAEVGDTYHCAASSTTVGIQCRYFTFNSGLPYGSGDPAIHQTIGFIINAAQNVDIAYEEVSMKQQHQITNQSNFDIVLEGWLLECRRDLPNVTKYQLTTPNQLNQAFLNVSAGSGTTLFNNCSVTPFQANPFLLDYKICKHFIKIMKPGKTLMVDNNSNQTKIIRPAQFIYMTASQTLATGSLTVFDRRGERYWLFRIYSSSLGTDDSTKLLIMDIGAKINMITKTIYEYKYVQDINSVVNMDTTSGIAAQSGNVDVINSTSGVNNIEATE